MHLKESSTQAESEDPAHYWGQFKDTKCLYTSCLLSGELIPVSVNAAMINLVEESINAPKITMTPNQVFRLQEQPQYTLTLPDTTKISAQDVHDLNIILTYMGCTLDADGSIKTPTTVEIPAEYIYSSIDGQVNIDENRIQEITDQPTEFNETELAVFNAIQARHPIQTNATIASANSNHDFLYRASILSQSPGKCLSGSSD